jgi:hypothetical protein
MHSLPHRSPLSSIAAFFGGLLGLLLKVALVAFGVLLLLGALFAAAALTLGAVVWALLRGRRPERAALRARFERARRAHRAARPRSAGEVIDIEVREVR